MTLPINSTRTVAFRKAPNYTSVNPFGWPVQISFEHKGNKKTYVRPPGNCQSENFALKTSFPKLRQENLTLKKLPGQFFMHSP